MTWLLVWLMCLPPLATPCGHASERVRIQVTVRRLEELQVQEGSEVEVGQVLVERTQEREALQREIRQLETQLQEREEEPVDLFAEARVKGMRYLQQLESYEAQRSWFLQLQDAVDRYTLRAEHAQLRQLYQAALLAQAEWAAAEAQARIQLATHEAARQRQRAELTQQLSQLQHQLEEAGLIRAGVAGRVQRIKVLGQQDQLTTLEVLLQ